MLTDGSDHVWLITVGDGVVDSGCSSFCVSVAGVTTSSIWPATSCLSEEPSVLGDTAPASADWRLGAVVVTN